MKQKKFELNFTWLAALFLVLGVAFTAVAVITQLVPISPDSMTSYVNGVRQPSTEETVRTFRLIMLLAFGICGLAFLVTTCVLLARRAARLAKKKRLLQDGVAIQATVTECSPDYTFRVNRRPSLVLRCMFTDAYGRQYVFKGPRLRRDPLPYLPRGQVRIYHSREDITDYFVDVDGSVAAGSVMEI